MAPGLDSKGFVVCHNGNHDVGDFLRTLRDEYTRRFQGTAACGPVHDESVWLLQMAVVSEQEIWEYPK